MSKEEIRERMEAATVLVKAWPEWKQNILAQSSRPTVSTPREPVSSQASVEPLVHQGG